MTNPGSCHDQSVGIVDSPGHRTNSCYMRDKIVHNRMESSLKIGKITYDGAIVCKITPDTNA